MGNTCSTLCKKKDDSFNSSQISDKPENTEMKAAQINAVDDKENIPVTNHQTTTSDLKMEGTKQQHLALVVPFKTTNDTSSSNKKTTTFGSIGTGQGDVYGGIHDVRQAGGNISDIKYHINTIFQGNIYCGLGSELHEASTNSSPSSSQRNTEDWQQLLKTVQQSQKESYLTRFKTVNPFSLPFTFDIENTWVSLALREEKKDSQATEDHAELLKRAFDKVKMLIIEGDPATGKTSLMRRLAYEWAKGKQELVHYDLVLYAEFREVREKTFESIAELVLCYSKNYLTEQEYNNLKKLMNNNEQFCKEYRILVLLDGYDESSLEKQCSELRSYMKEKTIKKQLFFTTVITTRKGHLSNLRGREGRFVFAEVLGFTTKQQKEKYISNHFLSSEVDCKHNIAAVHHLLKNNENLNKLAETPLFLTFICLVHERIVDGTLLELYCSIIWWLIDRHQQDFPDRDIPCSFGFQNGSNDKFETIQEHYLHFPQLHCLGKLALSNLEESVFKPSDCEQFNLQPILEQVGLLRKEKNLDNSFKLATAFFFPHRTIQEFLAAFYCFCSNDPTRNWFLPGSELDIFFMEEFDMFLLRIALSDKMPIQAEKRKYYFERSADIGLDIAFDAFTTTAGFNIKLLNWFLSQCTNVQSIQLRDELNSTKHELNMFNDRTVHNESITPNMSTTILLTFSDLIKLHSLTFSKCTFEVSFQLSFTNCPSLKNLNFDHCEMECSTMVGIAALPAIDTVQFDDCKIDLATWQSITDQISNSNVKYLKLIFGKDFNKELLIQLQECNNFVKVEITIHDYTIHDYSIHQYDLLSFSDLTMLQSVKFVSCTFSANSQLSFTNGPSLKNLEFNGCEMKSSTNLGIAALAAIDTVKFYDCKIDLATWKSITDQIRKISINCLELQFAKNMIFEDDFNEEFLIHLQKCNNVEKIDITFSYYKIQQNSLFSFSDLKKLQLLSFSECIFAANTLLSIANRPSPKILQFIRCELENSTNLGIATLPAIDTVQFDDCKIDLATWQSITDQISNSNVKYLKLRFGEDFNEEYLIHLKKCNNVENMEISIWDYKILQKDPLFFSNLIKLHSLIFERCTFPANSQLSITNCPSLKTLKFRYCEMEKSTIHGIAALAAIDTLEFYAYKIDMATWESITDQISNSSVKNLQLSADFFMQESYSQFLHHFQKCGRIEEIHVNDDYELNIRDYILNHYEELVTTNLALTAQKLPALMSITISNKNGERLDEFRRLSEWNKEQIENAGRERNPHFSIKYVE